MKTAVCTSKKAKPATVELARHYAQQLDIPYVDDFESARDNYEQLLIVENNKLKLANQSEVFFFHPSMSKLRIEALKSGKKDNLIEAMQLQPGMSLLDTTLGLGSDSIVCAYVTGASGCVTALEASPLLAFVVRNGLQTYQDSDSEIVAACRRINVHNCYALDYLRQQPDAAFDIVYIDPMFTKGIAASCNMSALRAFAVADNLTTDTLQQAIRVARQRVVIKQPYYSELLQQIQFTRLCGGRYSRIKYAVIEII